jgi:cytochrome o ubiquinol oxidase subunit IV
MEGPSRAPGVAEQRAPAISTYIMGLALAGVLTTASFAVAMTDLIWPPGDLVALLVLAVAQMGVHLVFFLHLTLGPRDSNNILALAFGTLIIASGRWVVMDHGQPQRQHGPYGALGKDLVVELETEKASSGPLAA